MLGVFFYFDVHFSCQSCRQSFIHLHPTGKIEIEINTLHICKGRNLHATYIISSPDFAESTVKTEFFHDHSFYETFPSFCAKIK